MNTKMQPIYSDEQLAELERMINAETLDGGEKPNED